MEQIIYKGDLRYPAPKAYAAPASIEGLPTQAELDAHPRLMTFGELKDIIKTGDLGYLMRNKQLQVRYFEWAEGIKQKYGSTENYLTSVRLPWARPSTPQPSRSKHASTLSTDLSHLDLPSTPTSPGSPKFNAYPPPLSPTGEPKPNVLDPNADNHLDGIKPEPARLAAAMPVAKRHGRTPSVTISSSNLNTHDLDATPPILSIETIDLNDAPKAEGSSALASSGFVSLPSFNTGGASRPSASGTNTPGEGSGSVSPGYVVVGSQNQSQKAEPEYLKWDGEELDKERYAVLPNDWPYCLPYDCRHYVIWSKVSIAHPHLVDYDPKAWAKIEADGLGGFTGVTPLYRRPESIAPDHNNPHVSWDSTEPPQLGDPVIGTGSGLALKGIASDEWYGVDMTFAGPEQRKWAGVQYESPGGQEVGKMVRGLFDERGWECLWFLNPPRLQSVLGLSHFHVFARRKTPPEIDAAEAAWKARNH